MREDLARVTGRAVSRETVELIEHYAGLVRAAAAEQNLVSAGTLDSLWERHVLDSAQLVRFEPSRCASWVDIGSGAGFPGIIIALIVEGEVTLVEPRRLRADFLRETVATLGLQGRVNVIQARAERVEQQFDVITGRAVAALDRFLLLSHHLSTKKTIWLLPKGRGAKSELEEAQRSWHCVSRVEPSCIDPNSQILVLSKVGNRHE